MSEGRVKNEAEGYKGGGRLNKLRDKEDNEENEMMETKRNNNNINNIDDNTTSYLTHWIKTD